MPIYALNCIFHHLLHWRRLGYLVEFSEILQSQAPKGFQRFAVAAATINIYIATRKQDLRMLIALIHNLNEAV